MHTYIKGPTNTHHGGLGLGSKTKRSRLLFSRYYLKDAILHGGIPFNKAYGMTAFDYSGTDPRFNKVFNRAMSDHSTLVMKKILDTYKGFEGVKDLVDVGGGIGATLNLIVSKYPNMKGINFDLEHVIANAPRYSGMILFIFTFVGRALLMPLGWAKPNFTLARSHVMPNSFLVIAVFENIAIAQ